MDLYDKHMVSSSSLCKNKEVLTEIVGENGTVIVVIGNVSLLDMALVYIRVGLGTSHLIFSLFLHGFG